MKTLFAALLVVLSFNVFASVEVNPDAVQLIIEQSQLVKCEDNYCYDLNTLEELVHDSEFPDGMTVVFPIGLVTAEELQTSKQHVLDFYTVQYKSWLAVRSLTEN